MEREGRDDRAERHEGSQAAVERLGTPYSAPPVEVVKGLPGRTVTESYGAGEDPWPALHHYGSLARSRAACYTSCTMALADNVSHNIFTTRQAKNLSQAALAKKSKISVSYVSMLERGMRVPPLETLETIAKALGVPPLDLIQKPAGKAAGRARK